MPAAHRRRSPLSCAHSRPPLEHLARALRTSHLSACLLSPHARTGWSKPKFEARRPQRDSGQSRTLAPRPVRVCPQHYRPRLLRARTPNEAAQSRPGACPRTLHARRRQDASLLAAGEGGDHPGAERETRVGGGASRGGERGGKSESTTSARVRCRTWRLDGPAEGQRAPHAVRWGSPEPGRGARRRTGTGAGAARRGLRGLHHLYPTGGAVRPCTRVGGARGEGAEQQERPEQSKTASHRR